MISWLNVFFVRSFTASRLRVASCDQRGYIARDPVAVALIESRRHVLPRIAIDGEALGIVVGTLLMGAGLVLLRVVWARHIDKRFFGVLVGWLLIAASVAVYAWTLGPEDGTALALAGLSVLAYLVIGTGAERRTTGRSAERSISLEPEERPTNWSRAIAKALLAMVVAGVAAIGIGVAFAVAMPTSPADRIVIGGVLVPMLWGAGMAWTLSDAKLLRATFLLATVSALAYAIAFFPKALGT